MSDKGVILGNGPSRPVDISGITGVLYGCNALYRDAKPDHLVVNDFAMMLEIMRSTYAGRCHFTDFEPLPIGVWDMMAMELNLDIVQYYGDRDTATEFVLKGSTDVINVVWIGPNENHIQWGLKPKVFGMSSGLCALQLALDADHDEIDMIGFDGLKDKNYRNIYDGTSCYTYDPAAADKKRIPTEYIPLEADRWVSIYDWLLTNNPNTKVNLI